MFPARNNAEACLKTFYYSLFYCVHSSTGSKYPILLENLFDRDTNLLFKQLFKISRKCGTIKFLWFDLISFWSTHHLTFKKKYLSCTQYIWNWGTLSYDLLETLNLKITVLLFYNNNNKKVIHMHFITGFLNFKR